MSIQEQIEDRIYEFTGSARPSFLVLGVQSYAALHQECTRLWPNSPGTDPPVYRGLQVIVVPVAEFIEIGTGWQPAKAALYGRELRQEEWKA